MILIGIDCATEERKQGLALGQVNNGRPVLEEVYEPSKGETAVEKLSQWLHRGQPAILAFDAPLGWPEALGKSLGEHSAGEPLEASPDRLFSRVTDQTVHRVIGKKPLEVGANLIARTAHSALKLLGELREKTGWTIPLAWNWSDITETSAIEVYPAATLVARRIEAPPYKKPEFHKERQRLVNSLKRHIEMGNKKFPKQLKANPHAIDAAICVLAAADFLGGTCIQPENQEVARKDGWIWVRCPETPT